MQNIEFLKRVKKESRHLALLTNQKRNAVLDTLAQVLHDSAEEIFTENQKDLDKLEEKNPLYDRLLLHSKRLDSIVNGIKTIIALPSPLWIPLENKVMPNGLKVQAVSVPLGVVAMIYESRPNVTIDAFSLCFKSGNACVLKGGKEALYSNRILVKKIHEALVANDLSQDALFLFESTREKIHVLLQAQGMVDACIPRGSQGLIDFVRKNATVPVIETGAGVVHAYFDLFGDSKKARALVQNAKTRRVSVCNALDCLLIHKERVHDLFSLVEPLIDSGVELFAEAKAYDALLGNYPKALLKLATKENFNQEFLSYKMAVKVVGSVDEAVEHILVHGSGHSELIMTEKKKIAEFFIQNVDSAVIYINASTAFTDAGEFGLGSEIGISTQKLHARGPMGLASLTSRKWIVHGEGQVRSKE